MYFGNYVLKKRSPDSNQGDWVSPSYNRCDFGQSVLITGVTLARPCHSEVHFQESLSLILRVSELSFWTEKYFRILKNLE